MPQTSKTIVVEFKGGFKDGTRFNSASSNPEEVQQALGHYLMTSDGTVGKRFRCYSEAGLEELADLIESTPEGPRLKREPVYGMNHIYELAERIEADDSTTLRFQYAGKFQPGDPL